MANRVWFRNHDNEMLFKLNSLREIDVIPTVGDIVEFCEDDFSKASFRMKPDGFIWATFIVVSRKYNVPSNEWELKCNPTPEYLMYLLRGVKSR
jgi:hypothetical protein